MALEGYARATGSPESRAQRPRGRRADSRLHVRLPARIITHAATRQAVLCNLSVKGAQILVYEDLTVGCEALLEWGRFDAIARTVWCENGRCGLSFFDPLDPHVLIVTRDLDDRARLPRDHDLVRHAARHWTQAPTRV